MSDHNMSDPESFEIPYPGPWEFEVEIAEVIEYDDDNLIDLPILPAAPLRNRTRYRPAHDETIEFGGDILLFEHPTMMNIPPIDPDRVGPEEDEEEDMQRTQEEVPVVSTVDLDESSE
jgi:hypothetical protein